MEKYQEVERSIIKKFRPSIWHNFVKAVSNYDLISENDKIAVCISGGKDSFLLAKCLEELQKHGKIKFDLEYVIMNPGYTDEVLDKIKDNLKILNINAHIFESPIFKIISKEKNPCYLCAKMRRGYLYNYAKELGCNKIALGHHFDDILETDIGGVMYLQTYISDNFEGMELIRPLYLIREDSILDWVKYNNLSFIDCACSVTKRDIGKRKEMKELVKTLKEYYADADRNIFKSLSNVKLDKVINYFYEDKSNDFLDKY